MHPPTAQNVRVSTVEEARHFVEAVLGGRLPEYRCRLGRDGVHIVKPGTVFVYQHKGPSGIDRWTDGLKGYCGSTNRQGFLCYVLPEPPTGGPAWVRKTWSYTFDTPGGGEVTWNFVAYDYDDEANGRELAPASSVLSPRAVHVPHTPPLSPSSSSVSSFDADDAATVVTSPLYSPADAYAPHSKIHSHRYMPYSRPALTGVSPEVPRRATWPVVEPVIKTSRARAEPATPMCVLLCDAPLCRNVCHSRRLPPPSQSASQRDCLDDELIGRFL